MLRRITLLAIAVALAVPASALGVAPLLTSMTVEDRHPVAVFSAPRASDATIYLASSPARATDGRFLEENIAEIDFLTESEIQLGRWLYEQRVDPGTYWALLRVSPDFNSCWLWDVGGYDPACADGFSNVVQLVVPKPTVRFTARAKATFWSYSRPDLDLTLTARPLGEKLGYRVCWRQMVGAKFIWQRICRSRTLAGYSWDSSASDTLRFSYNEGRMARYTTFTWYVGGSKVASRRILTCRCD